MRLQEQAEANATAKAPLNPDAPSSLPPSPPSLTQRVAAVASAFLPEDFGPGDRAERLLPLVAIYEEWLGRPATEAELSEYADAVSWSNLGEDNRREVLAGDYLQIPIVEGHLYVSTDFDALALLREEHERQGRRIHLAEALAQRIDPIGVGLEVPIAKSGEGQLYSLILSRGLPGSPRYQVDLNRVVPDADEIVDFDFADDFPGLIDRVFALGRSLGKDEAGAKTISCADNDLVAIAALRPGETWTRLLVDAHVVKGEPCGVDSLRSCVQRPFDGRGLFVFLEQYGPGTGNLHDTWTPINPLSIGDECLMVAEGFDDDVEIVDALTIHQVYAAHMTAIMRDEARLDTEAATANTVAPVARDPVAEILALNVGERWTEERWGPYYVPGAEIQKGRYMTASLRIVVGRTKPDGEHNAFLFHTESRYEGGEWNHEDLGFGTRERDEAFEMCADTHTLGTCLAAFRALLDHEGLEAGDRRGRPPGARAFRHHRGAPSHRDVERPDV